MYYHRLSVWIAVLFLSGSAWAATRADVHLEVFSSGFLTTTQRQVTYAEQTRRAETQMQGQGTAQGEATLAHIEIDRLDKGLAWQMDPPSKTYQELKYVPSRSQPASDAVSKPNAH